jgi:hypothetical protein
MLVTEIYWQNMAFFMTGADADKTYFLLLRNMRL